MNISKQSIITLTVVVLALLLLGGVTYQVQQQTRLKNSDAAKTLGSEDEVQYATLSGEQVSFETFNGSIRIVNSWASWSPYSKAELPILEQIANEYKDRGVVVVAINRNEDHLRAEHFVRTLGTFEHMHILIDPDDAFYARMDGKAMPETMIFDAEGKTVAHIRGQIERDQVISILDQLTP